jgi:hypothetical protein
MTCFLKVEILVRECEEESSKVRRKESSASVMERQRGDHHVFSGVTGDLLD